MGWVSQRIEDHQKISESLSPLWNTLRDSVGHAITEYKSRVSAIMDYSDCHARGWMCIRVQKAGSFIEIFLSSSDQKVKSALGLIDLNRNTETPGVRDICGYRLKEDRSALEFHAGANSITSDNVAQRALEEFLFQPFPTHIRPAL